MQAGSLKELPQVSRVITHLRFVQELDRDADRAGELAHLDGGMCDTEGDSG